MPKINVNKIKLLLKAIKITHKVSAYLSNPHHQMSPSSTQEGCEQFLLPKM